MVNKETNEKSSQKNDEIFNKRKKTRKRRRSISKFKTKQFTPLSKKKVKRNEINFQKNKKCWRPLRDDAFFKFAFFISREF